jgi:flagellin
MGRSRPEIKERILMGLRINQNIAAMNAYRNLSVTDGQMSKSLEKLSSGYRINRAADDAAGLVVSEGLRAQIGGLKVAVRNAQDGISVVQTAEGALTETHSILQRMRDLAVQSSSDTNDQNSRSAMDAESNQLKLELDRISNKTTYNNINLLDGSYAGKKIQVGYAASDTITVDIKGGQTAASYASTTNAGSLVTTAGAFTISQAVDAETTLTPGTSAAISVTTGSLAVTTSVAGTVDALNADVAFATSFTASIDTSTVPAGVLKITSKTGNASAVAIAVVGAAVGLTTGAGTAASATAAGGFDTTGLNLSGSSLLSQAVASTAITTLDAAIKTVSTARASLGAMQNRFEHSINNINVSVENLSASESRIRDTDMAQEMVQFTRSQILSQAGTAMLAQANQAPQSVLSLLRG